MGLQDVKNEIRKEAEARADELIEEAEARREQLLGEARDEADEIVSRAEEEAEDEADQLRRKRLSAARMEAKKKKLDAREELLQDVYDTFRERVQNLDDETEAELIENTLERLSDQVDIGTVQVADQHSDLAGDYGDVETDDINGVIVETADGSRRFNLQFEEVAEQVINDNKQAVSEVLFE